MLARRDLVLDKDREDQEVSNKTLTSMAHDVATGLAFLHQQK